MSTEPTTLELRRAAKRAMFRAFPKHTAGWSLDRMVADGNHEPGQSQAPQHSTGWHPKREREDFYWQGRPGRGKHRRNAKHRENSSMFNMATRKADAVLAA